MKKFNTEQNYVNYVDISMKYFIDNCSNCHEKIYLDLNSQTKKQLLATFGDTFEIKCPYCHQNHTCNTENVKAEFDQSNLPVGLIIGGFLGASIAGPAGALGLGIIGGFLGSCNDNKQEELIDHFNKNLEIEDVENPFFRIDK